MYYQFKLGNAVVKAIRVRLFSQSERLLLMTAALNHGSDVRRTGNDPEPSFLLAEQFAPADWRDVFSNRRAYDKYAPACSARKELP